MGSDAQQPARPDLGALVGELADFVVAIGMITMIGFPFAIPFLLLTAAVVLPMLVIALAAAVIALAVTGPVLLIARARRRRRAARDVQPTRSMPSPAAVGAATSQRAPAVYRDTARSTGR